MRRALVSAFVVVSICAVLGAAMRSAGGESRVTVASVDAQAPLARETGSVSHPMQFTLAEALAPQIRAVTWYVHGAGTRAMQAAEAANARLVSTRLAAPSETHVPVSLAPAPYATGTVNGNPCGGSLPPCCVLQRESGGNPEAQNPISSASGLWQFLDSTWTGVTGLPGRAADYSAATQNAAAVKLWAGGVGYRNWIGDGCLH